MCIRDSNWTVGKYNDAWPNTYITCTSTLILREKNVMMRNSVLVWIAMLEQLKRNLLNDTNRINVKGYEKNSCFSSDTKSLSGIYTVSYTHLDVYKRQVITQSQGNLNFLLVKRITHDI